jgi:hypothetical protein
MTLSADDGAESGGACAPSASRSSFPPGDVTSELLVPNLRNKLEVFHLARAAGRRQRGARA